MGVGVGGGDGVGSRDPRDTSSTVMDEHGKGLIMPFYQCTGQAHFFNRFLFFNIIFVLF